MTSTPDIPLPPGYWNAISQEDRAEFIRLRTNFHHGQKISSKDRRIVTFRKELLIVLHYLERTQENMESRCVLTGVCFVGPIICVNTRQLKSFLSRCKSSINGSFQQLGYVALRTKAKARNCVVAALPSLQNQQNILRQWTVRVASNECQFCFLSSFSHVQLPEINEDDLFDEKKPTPAPKQQHYFQQQVSMNFQPPPVNRTISSPLHSPPAQLTPPIRTQSAIPHAPLRTTFLDFDLPKVSGFDNSDDEPSALPPMSTSFSVDCFQDVDANWTFGAEDDSPLADPIAIPYQRVFGNTMVKSVSAQFPQNDHWDMFDFDTF